MKSKMARPALAACALASLLALAACGDRIEDTEMAQAQQANVEINRQGMDGAKAAEEAAGVRNDGSVQLATGDSSVFDPDVLIAEQVKAALSANPDFGAVKIDVHSDEGDVTLRGTAPDPSSRDRASDIARSVRNVKSVDNQLTLG
ncbi:MAG: BON domain-containing protein [Comamonadaceae bacterium]|nr:MAG: BON domain-containing protein [Comamonadaceae bacterium]